MKQSSRVPKRFVAECQLTTTGPNDRLVHEGAAYIKPATSSWASTIQSAKLILVEAVAEAPDLRPVGNNDYRARLFGKTSGGPGRRQDGWNPPQGTAGEGTALSPIDCFSATLFSTSRELARSARGPNRPRGNEWMSGTAMAGTTAERDRCELEILLG